MNVKKIATMAIATLAMAVSATGFAQISKSDLNIGGIYYGQSWSDFIAKYGQPVRKEKRAPVGYNNKIITCTVLGTNPSTIAIEASVT